MIQADGLRGRSALVTGSTSGIGRAVAYQLGAAGVRVLVTGRDVERLQETVDTIRRHGGAAEGIAADLSTAAGIRQLAERIADDQMGILVLSAGRSEPLAAVADPKWPDVMRLQFDSVRLLTEAALPGMNRSRWGRVVHIGGTLEPGNGVNGSTVAKSAALAWAKGLSNEVGGAGITINTVVPGRVLTMQVEEFLHPDQTEREQFARRHIPLGRFGEPDEVAHVVLFLVSNLGSYVTGEVIHVDGGMRRAAF